MISDMFIVFKTSLETSVYLKDKFVCCQTDEYITLNITRTLNVDLIFHCDDGASLPVSILACFSLLMTN